MKIDRALVRRLRLQKSWSQDELAAAARVNLRTIQRIELKGTGSLRPRCSPRQPISCCK